MMSNSQYFEEEILALFFKNYNLLPMLNVYENIVLPIELDGKSVDQEFLKEIISILGLEERINSMPNMLSGGQQQRVAIARALITKPAIILADEPTGNLDSRTSQDVLELIQNTSRRFEQTVVMITHNEHIAGLTERIVQIEDGKFLHNIDSYYLSQHWLPKSDFLFPAHISSITEGSS
mgnify:CR=1 FL=1